jgi:hypothetical protein
MGYTIKATDFGWSEERWMRNPVMSAPPFPKS